LIDMTGTQKMSKAEAAKVLREVGLTATTIKEILDPLPEPLDLDRDGDHLLRHGVTRDRLINRMGGSP
jgi:hypothetical protein